jgi:hypothetical protein
MPADMCPVAPFVHRFVQSRSGTLSRALVAVSIATRLGLLLLNISLMCPRLAFLQH